VKKYIIFADIFLSEARISIIFISCTTSAPSLLKKM